MLLTANDGFARGDETRSETPMTTRYFAEATAEQLEEAAAACRRAAAIDDTAWDGDLAREAREFTDALGWSWDFTSWSDAAKILENAATKGLVIFDIMEYDTAINLGQAEMPRDQWELYAAGSHPDYQWPQGIARAGDVLSRDQLDAIDLDPDTTIYLN
jgi:hypothetical protein